eukprot:3436802-Rhodomonas_salina.1
MGTCTPKSHTAPRNLRPEITYCALKSNTAPKTKRKKPRFSARIAPETWLFAAYTTSGTEVADALPHFRAGSFAVQCPVLTQEKRTVGRCGSY